MEAHVEELHRFLRTRRILNVQRELVQESGSPCWAVCVEYLEPVAGASASEASSGVSSASSSRVESYGQAARQTWRAAGQ